ncbi:MAG: flagellar basal-body MS-ring/collar protein FliF [Burkholderiaceae bacterium]
MASDNPAMPSPVPMGPMPGAGSSTAGADAQGTSLGTSAQTAAAQAGTAASQAASAAGSTLKRGAEIAGPLLQNLNLPAFLRDGLSNPLVKKAVPALLVIFVLVAFVGLFNLMGKPVEHKPLMPGISEADKQEAFDALKMASFDPKIDPSTGSITVPDNKFHEARIYLASKGIPKAPLPMGIDALNEQSAMTTSQFMEQVRYIKAMENELARSITEIGSIQSARVHLALPKQSVFVRDRAEPKASVVVSPQHGRIVTAAQVDAIIHLVSSSIPYLAAQNVSVVDNIGNLLTDRRENTPMGLTDAQLNHKQRVEQAYNTRIMELLIPILGEGNVRAQVDVTMDFTQSEVAVEDFDNSKTGPKTRSEVLAEDRTQRLTAEGIPGSITNTPPPPTIQTDQTGASANDALQENTVHSKRATRNYEIDKTVRYVKNPTGTVTRISAAVVVNEKEGYDPSKQERIGAEPSNPPAEGQGAAPQARPSPAEVILHGYTQTELDRLTNLVRGAVGFQEGRGDIVTLVPAKFAPLEPEKQWFENEDFMNAVKVALTSLIFLVILLTIIRPVVNLLTGQTMSPKEIAKMELEAQKRAQEESAQRVAQEAEAKAIAEAEAKAAAGEDGTEGKEGEGADGEAGKGADGEDLPATELSPEELGMIEMQEGESLEDIKARLKPKKSTISIDMLNTANSYDDKVALIRFLVSEDSGRVATVMKNLVKG